MAAAVGRVLGREGESNKLSDVAMCRTRKRETVRRFTPRASRRCASARHRRPCCSARGGRERRRLLAARHTLGMHHGL